MCGGLKNWFDQQDADELLAYSTLKLVRIRDRWLGLLHYTFQLAIFIYVVIFVIIINKGYMKFDNPTGSIQYTVRRCTPDCPVVEISKIPYCNEAQVEGSNEIDGCRVWDEFQAVLGLEAGGFYAVTRVTDTVQVRADDCPDTIYNGNEVCQRVWFDVNATEQFGMPGVNDLVLPKNPVTYYTVNVEDFSLKLDHNVNALEFLESRPNSEDLQGVSIEMDGTLRFLEVDSSGNILSFIGTESEDIEYPAGEPTFVTLKTLMKAAGMYQGDDDNNSENSLDSLSDLSANSKRYDGIVLLLVITYRNDYPFFIATSKAKYEMQVFKVKNAEFKYEYQVETGPSRRIRRNTHGIRMLFLQQGRLGRFSFQVFLVQMVSALALLKLATTIVDLIALNLLPHKAYYRDFKYQVTKDFSDVRDEEREMKRRASAPDPDTDNLIDDEKKQDLEKGTLDADAEDSLADDTDGDTEEEETEEEEEEEEEESSNLSSNGK